MAVAALIPARLQMAALGMTAYLVPLPQQAEDLAAAAQPRQPFPVETEALAAAVVEAAGKSTPAVLETRHRSIRRKVAMAAMAQILRQITVLAVAVARAQ